jgi:hypothetical protein
MKKNKLPLFVLFVSIYFSCKTSSIHLNAISQQSIQMNKEVVSDEEFTKEIEPFKTILDKEMNAVLIVSENEALKGTPESELGNVVTDMVLYKAKQYAQSINKDVDFCMLNNGGLRGSLPKGDINLGKIFELMPFENENDQEKLLNLLVPNDSHLLTFHTVQKLKGKGALGNVPQTTQIYNYEDLDKELKAIKTDLEN